jgi:hypothetical protein
MKRFAPIIIAVIAIGSAMLYQRFAPATNPDPNHTHADFAVWFDDQQIDFSRPEFMSAVYVEGQEVRTSPMRKYLHLHDGNGHVIHRHKPGLTLAEFFASLDMEFTKDCFRLDPDHAGCDGKMFVNGEEIPMNPDYVFSDGDKILITFTDSDELVQMQLKELTDDACKYSKTCPWRGAPPTENCIADPEVPCVIPE